MEKKGVLSDLVCETSVTLIPKREKALETKEERKRERRAEGGRKERRKEDSYKPIFLMNIDAKYITKY